jgi:hypothetical protein
MFEAPSMVRDFLNATLSMTPAMMDGIMNMMLEPEKVGGKPLVILSILISVLTKFQSTSWFCFSCDREGNSL